MNEQYDIVIAGAGPAGVAAAITAARYGCSVLLVESSDKAGGTVAGSLIHTLGGLFDDSGNLLNHGLSEELCQRLQNASQSVVKRRIGRTWCLAVDPAIFRQKLEDWLSEEDLILLQTKSRVTAGCLNSDNLFQLKLELDGQPVCLNAGAVIDATGAAALVRLLAPESVLDPLERAAAGLILRLQGCDSSALNFPGGIEIIHSIRKACQAGELSSIAGSAWLDTGLLPDEVFVKLALPLPETENPEKDKMLVEQADEACVAITGFLRQYPVFRNAYCVEYGRIGLRDGSVIRGVTCLTEADLLGCVIGPETACLGAWPLEYWDKSAGPQLRYLPPGGRYGIPVGCLKVAGHHRLWAAGKCLSAEPEAQASVRVAGCCWATGDAVGRAAAEELKG